MFAALKTPDIRSLPFDAAACPRASLDDLSDDIVEEFLARAQKNCGYALGPGTPRLSALTHLNLLDGDRPSHAAVDYEIPRDAVAEAIVNAVAHRDYLEHTIPEKPQSRLQKYRITAKGRSHLGKPS